jgi:hypothetical protein
VLRGWTSCVRLTEVKGAKEGVDLSGLVNDLLRKDIELIEMAR